MAQDEMRKGPWTEQEDLLLLCVVGLSGDRRWDFIAKVSGLNRTGKSCRLRWVNYLHPGLKRSKMTPQEERLVLELHSKWGNRWSRIARRLPGRTDNEIKNYWRTHMRKKAQEKKRVMFSASSSSDCSSAASNNPSVDSMPVRETGEESFYDTGGLQSSALKTAEEDNKFAYETCSSLDDIWKDIAMQPVETMLKPVFSCYSEENCCFNCPPMAYPSWEYCSDSVWMMEEEECKMFSPINDQGTQLIRF